MQSWKTNCKYLRYSAASRDGGGRNSCGCGGDGRRGHIPDIVFLDVRIVHTSVKFSKVIIVTLNKVVGVVKLLKQTKKCIRLVLNLGRRTQTHHGHSQHGSSVGEGSNKSESRASGRHV